MKFGRTTYLLILIFGISACAEKTNVGKEGTTGVEKISKTPNKDLRLQPVEPFAAAAAYPELEMGPFIYDAGELKFIVLGPTLGIKTPGLENKTAQVSGKGLYLHIVLNDTQHIVENYRNIPIPLPDGPYRMGAFVARANHESVKSPKGFVARNFELRAGRTAKSFPAQEAMLLYGAPRGEYFDAETENVLLDFYLVNTTIGAAGNRVRVLVDGTTEFFVETWQAHYLKGLGLGPHRVDLELQNAAGQRIYGPVGQNFTLIKN